MEPTGNMRNAVKLLVLSALIGLIGDSTAQEIHIGGCPNVFTAQNFDVERYQGDWYEITKFYFRPLVGDKCNQANYTIKADGHIKVLNRAIKSDGSEDSRVGDAYPPDPKVPSKLDVQFPGSPLAKYWVIDTDYDNYSLVWSCTDIEGLINLDLAWILSRKRTLDPRTVSMLKQELGSFGIKTDGFIDTDQVNCPL